ncbi:MAG TPA: restriction endonuclease [Gammaproteobacteria bacterium]|nr:restriction endonuclease [Gammaproteobacteria bacterium]
MGVYVSESVRTHPRHFLVQYLEESFSLWVYIWTLTFGGRQSLPNEYRIQMTSISSPLSINSNGYTILLGYYPDLNIFAGFDCKQHSTFTTGSPSIQININAIHNALQNGLAFMTKDNQEIAIAIRSDQFLNYVLNAQILHQYGSDTTTLNLLTKAAQSEEIKPQDIESLTVERKKLVTNVSRYARTANFRQQVLNAYENRCAVTRTQLKLVDAAHILPVVAQNSSDHVSNGIALSPTMHRAYDNCLIYLDENYQMKLNDDKANELIAHHLHGGLEQLKHLLDQAIHLPADRNQRPNLQFIREANKYRRISGYY